MYQKGVIWHLVCGLLIQGGCNPAPEIPWKGLTFISVESSKIQSPDLPHSTHGI